MPSDDIVTRLRAHAKIPCCSDQWKLDSARANCPNTDIVVRLKALIALAARNNGKSDHLSKALDEIERLRAHVRALEIEIERYRIQCVRISDLERMLEVQDTQLEHAQRALRILEGHKHEQQG